MSTLVSSPTWPSSIYELRGTDLRMLIFPSRKEYERGIHLFIRDEELSKIPYTMTPKPMGRGYDTAFVVPVTAIPLIKAKGLKFRVVEPIAMSDLTPKQRKALRQKKAFLIGIGTKDPVRVFIGKHSERLSETAGTPVQICLSIRLQANWQRRWDTGLSLPTAVILVTLQRYSPGNHFKAQ